ncbi:MAG: hypothetical protein WCR82_04205, partial [Bacteroidales bacterium]
YYLSESLYSIIFLKFSNSATFCMSRITGINFPIGFSFENEALIFASIFKLSIPFQVFSVK